MNMESEVGFNFVEKIIDFIPEKKAVATRKITLADTPYLVDNNQKKSLLPCLLAEAVGQLNAWIVMQHNQFTLRPIAILYGEMQFLSDAYLDDTLIIETELKSLDEKTSLFDGRVRVGDRVIFQELDAAGAFLPMQDFIEPEIVKQEYHDLINSGIKQTAADLQTQINVAYDEVVAVNETKIEAKKFIENSEIYFKDHFPNKAVLPISILLQTTINLASDYINENIQSANKFVIESLSNIKIAEFMLPGELLVTKLNIKQKEAEFIDLRFRTEINNKRVCMGQMRFKKI